MTNDLKKTLMERAREGTAEPVLAKVSKSERVPLENLMQNMAEGRAVAAANPFHQGVTPPWVRTSQTGVWMLKSMNTKNR